MLEAVSEILLLTAFHIDEAAYEETGRQLYDGRWQLFVHGNGFHVFKELTQRDEVCRKLKCYQNILPDLLIDRLGLFGCNTIVVVSSSGCCYSGGKHFCGAVSPGSQSLRGVSGFFIVRSHASCSTCIEFVSCGGTMDEGGTGDSQ